MRASYYVRRPVRFYPANGHYSYRRRGMRGLSVDYDYKPAERLNYSRDAVRRVVEVWTQVVPRNHAPDGVPDNTTNNK